jgi:NAD(P)-dependent dehydrogenase (short-subunit alcohol dehydrogenase family)
MRLLDKVAIITGAASGIGRAIALGFAREGAHIAIGDIDAEGAESVVKKIEAMGRRAIVVRTDVSNAHDVEILVNTTVRALGEVNILVNNAAIVGEPPLTCQDIHEETWDKVLAVNLKGVLLCSQSVVKAMIRQNKGGKIVNISSISGEVYIGIAPNYHVSKAGIIMLTKAMAIEFARFNITVNAIGPGLIETAASKPLLDIPENRAYAQNIVPLGRIGQPEDIVGPALFLASQDSDFVTGQTIFVDGGFLYLHPTVPLASYR